MGNPMIVHERSMNGCKVSEKGSEGAQYHENHIGIRRGPRTRDTCDFELEKVNTRSARWRGMSLLYRSADCRAQDSSRKASKTLANDAHRKEANDASVHWHSFLRPTF
uniref:uncharacterized protein LOC117159640 n=1 Tax=Bombus vancouverensis nearcticus TaxID=2705178 RepID=UPI00143A1DB9|nr:uncharacterized protein LOC117159640 [Bombus vancouverensis nearcticus]